MREEPPLEGLRSMGPRESGLLKRRGTGKATEYVRARKIRAINSRFGHSPANSGAPDKPKTPTRSTKKRS